jgi:hypothetical protein
MKSLLARLDAPSPLRGVLLVAAAVAIVACSGSGPASPPPGGTPNPSPDPTTGTTNGDIDHAMGSTDVVFRFEEGGGFVPMSFFATEAPTFTLYGDGTVIFRDGTAAPPPAADGILRMAPFQTTHLDEAAIQVLLHYAIADAGLGVARDSYSAPGADLPTAIFTINAAGQTRTVSVMALGMDREDGPDTPILRALGELGDRVRAYGGVVDGEVPWAPDRWRGVLTPDSQGPPRDWPWPSIAPADFVQRSEPGAPSFPVRTLTAAEVDMLGLDGIDGGFSGLDLSGPDGRVYFFALRPLLPDEPY